MGKRRHNWKAREKIDTEIDRTEEKKIKLDIDVGKDNYDDSNPLALPSEKRKTKKKGESQVKVKRLTKKERKRLQKILEQKEKKAKRADILKSLTEVQATDEEMKMFTSISEVHSQKYKKDIEIKTSSDGQVQISTVSNKKPRQVVSTESDDEDIVSDKEDSESSVHTSDISTDDEIEEAMNRPQKNTKDINNEVGVKKEENDNVQKEVIDLKTTENKSVGEKKTVSAVFVPAVHVPVSRTPEIQATRLKLPITGEEQVIVEKINEHSVIIICGETGSGKTTQVPQFLYEAGYAHQNNRIIGVTEPRRVAAISMSSRVAEEMNLSSSEVSYQIRYEGNVTDDTKIKFMTDGVLLKEVQKDFLLTRYNVIIIDEAHERSVYTDILIGLLSRIVPLRLKKGVPLKLIIMSATLRVEDFTENTRLFRTPPPVIEVNSRQYPVTIHFNRRTPFDDYLGEAYRKACKVHRMLPEGGILVFVTGQQEVHTLCKKLKNTFPVHADKPVQKQSKKTRKERKEEKKNLPLPQINLDNYSISPVDEEAQMEADAVDDSSDVEPTEDFLDSSGDEEKHEAVHESRIESPLYVLPLYSLLSTEKQSRVFKPPPEGTRLCVISTNVAETSITIPGIKYVVDTGKMKTKFYDKVTGVSTFKVTWISKAAANQRAGRAGRVSAGHCYRLYSSALFNDDFQKFSPAEITRRPVDDLVLQMKDMDIDKIINFPFPTQPDPDQIRAAEKLLTSLGALKASKESKKREGKVQDTVTKITPLGRAMACFPVSPRYAKMLSLGQQHDLLPYVVALVSALSVQELFNETQRPTANEEEEHLQKEKMKEMLRVKRLWAGTGHSLLLGDLMVLLKAVGSCEYEGCTLSFCEKHGIRYKAMKEIRKLRAQLTNTVNLVMPNANLCIDPQLKPPNEIQAKLLRQIILSGLADHVARRNPDVLPGTDAATRKKMKNSYQCDDLAEPVFIHPMSILYKEKAEFIVYQQISETTKLYMKGITAVEPSWLPVFAPSYCTFSKPLDEPKPRYDEKLGQVVCHMTSTYGRCCWPLPAVELEYPVGLDRFKWLAIALLEGTVCPKLKKYAANLLSAASTMIKTWARLQPRTEILLNALISENVDSKEKLVAACKKNSSYLLSAYLAWIPESLHTEVRDKWPPT